MLTFSLHLFFTTSRSMPALRALLVAVTALLSMGAGCEPPVEPPTPPEAQDVPAEEQETAKPEEVVEETASNEASESGEGDSLANEAGTTEAGGAGSGHSNTTPGASTGVAANGDGDQQGFQTDTAGSDSAEPNRRFVDAAAATSHASGQLKKGKQMTPSGASIEVLLDGWRAAGEYPTDPKCSSVASALIAELRRHDRVVSGNGNARPFDDMPLKIR
jgi:hypothetical protein